MKLCTLLEQYKDDLYFRVEEARTKKIKGVGTAKTLLECLPADILVRDVMLCVPDMQGQIYRLIINTK